MCPSSRLLAVIATVFALGACNSSGDEATLRISLGSALQALTVDTITIDRYELEVTCVDGSKTTHDGDIGDDGGFSAEVPNCPQATIRFRGLTNTRMPALDGSVAAAIRAPATDVTIPVRRVGSVIILNDDDYTSVCKVSVENAPQYDRTFELAPGASRKEVVPVNGTTLSCAPADVCSLAACDFAGPLATTRTVAVSFGGESTISLANLTNSLVFTTTPPSPLLAGVQWAPFTVSLVDERGVPINRSDVFVNLVADSSTAHGGFQNGLEDTSAGAAFFPFVTFTTSGALSMRATADVDGVTLSTPPVVIDILPDATALLELVGPATAIAGVPIDLVINGADQYGNRTNAPTTIVLDSTDPLAVGRLVDATVQGAQLVLAAQTAAGTTFELRTAGLQTIHARSSQDPSVAGSLTLDVGPGATTSLRVASSLARIIPTQQTTLTVTAQDNWGNPVPSYAGTVSLSYLPSGGVTDTGPYTYGPADAGVHAFVAHFDAPGQRLVQATDGALTSTSIGVNVVPATDLGEIIFTLPQSPVRAGDAVPITLTAVNVAGDVLPNFWDFVEVRASGCDGTEVSFYGMAGVVTANLTCRTAGTWTLTANYADTDVGTSGPLTVIAGSPYRLVLASNPPSTVLVGNAFSASFRLEDINNNTANPAEHPDPIVITMSPASIVLTGTTPVIVGNILTYPGLTAAQSGSDLQIVASTTNLEVNTAATSYFEVAENTGCPVAYVRPGGTGDGCSAALAAGTISSAIDRVDDGGKVLVAVGTYPEQLRIAKSLVIKGGYDVTFSEATRNPLLLTKIKPPVDTFSAVETTSSVTATIDGFFIAAADLSTLSGSTTAVNLNGGATVTLENNRIMGAVVDSAVSDFSAIRIDSAPYVTIRNNWIHSGGSTAGRAVGTRRAILAGFNNEPSAPTVTIVHNTFYVADADVGEALFYQGIGDYRVTNNIIIGNFSRCDLGAGVCAIREQQGDSQSVYSKANNYIMQTNGAGAYVYMDYSGITYTTLDSFAPQDQGNVNEVNALPQADFVRFTERSFESDDWHLVRQGAFGIGRDATFWTCGSAAYESCGGNGRDIDGQSRTAPICAGADEQDTL